MPCFLWVVFGIKVIDIQVYLYSNLLGGKAAMEMVKEVRRQFKEINSGYDDCESWKQDSFINFNFFSSSVMPHMPLMKSKKYVNNI